MLYWYYVPYHWVSKLPNNLPFYTTKGTLCDSIATEKLWDLNSNSHHRNSMRYHWATTPYIALYIKSDLDYLDSSIVCSGLISALENCGRECTQPLSRAVFTIELQNMGLAPTMVLPGTRINIFFLCSKSL